MNSKKTLGEKQKEMSQKGNLQPEVQVEGTWGGGEVRGCYWWAGRERAQYGNFFKPLNRFSSRTSPPRSPFPSPQSSSSYLIKNITGHLKITTPGLSTPVLTYCTLSTTLREDPGAKGGQEALPLSVIRSPVLEVRASGRKPELRNKIISLNPTPPIGESQR